MELPAVPEPNNRIKYGGCGKVSVSRPAYGYYYAAGRREVAEPERWVKKSSADQKEESERSEGVNWETRIGCRTGVNKKRMPVKPEHGGMSFLFSDVLVLAVR